MPALRAVLPLATAAIVLLPWLSTATDEEICNDRLDNDGDGEVDCGDSDCCEEPSCAGLPCPRFRRADLDEDGVYSVTDALLVLAFLFASADLPCARAADADDSGMVDVADAVYVLQYLFQRGPRPQAPSFECGRDPTPDALRCTFDFGHQCR